MQTRYTYEKRKKKRIGLQTPDKRIAAVDRTWLLPEPILQHILFFLPTKDAARTSILSNTWKQVWASLPILAFDFDQTLFGKELLSTERQEPETQAKREEFMKFIDDSLLKLREQRVSIWKLRLFITLHDFKFASRIDHWLGLAGKNYIRELDLDIRMGKDNEHEWYSLPPTSFAAEALTILRLCGCKLNWPLFSDNTNFASLQELSLVKVYVDEQIIQNIISSCHAIEIFSLRYCSGVENLRLSNLPKLKSVTAAGVDSIEIDAPSLQVLRCKGKNGPVKIKASACKNLKMLSIITFGFVTNEFISEFPLLETLALLSWYKSERLKISSRHLKRLYLGFYRGPTEAEIDTPNLLSFMYGGDILPSPSLLNTSSVQEAVLKLLPRDHLGTLWFLKLREYLGKFREHNVLSLHIYSLTNAFIRDEFREISAPPLSDLKHLKLDFIPSSLDYIALVDGLLWSSHPENLSVKSGLGSNNEFIKFLCKELMDREEEPYCCGSRRIKCWRHYLKGVEIENFAGIEEKKAIHYSALLESLPTLESGQQINFKLKW